jgi:hypothetical protein
VLVSFGQETMANLPKDPTGWELEDFVAAHFVSRGCYVETGVKERNPDELLELDLVWTDYRKEPPTQSPVETKSGDWRLGDVFKFYGWTQYLGLKPGAFVFIQPNGRLKQQSLDHIAQRTGMQLVHVPAPADFEKHFKRLGLPEPSGKALTEIWRFSFWAQRRLLRSLSEAIRQGVCRECSKAAKEYHQLINDAVFFIPDVQERIGALISAHFEHQHLGASAALERETGKVEFANPPQTSTFQHAAYRGEHFPIQACLYLAHRARLYILKAIVDYWLARERGEIKKTVFKFGDALVDLTGGRLSGAMAKGLDELSVVQSFRMFPVFWQVFLWSWGGFLRKDRQDEEFADLANETGVEIKDIPVALTAFDRLFPVTGGWFREPDNDSRRVLMLMPAAMRGIGGFRRLAKANVSAYRDLGFKDQTAGRIASDHNAGARLLDSEDEALVK